MLGVQEEPGRPLAEDLAAYLRDRRLLLILDNLEQLVDGASFVAGLLAAAPDLKVVATSRIHLGLRAEHEYAVPTLAAPDPRNLTGVITPGERVASVPTNVVLYRDGVPVAARIGRERRLLRDEASRDERRRIETALVGPAGTREARE